MKKQKNDTLETYIELSPDKACQILKNVFHACGKEPPDNCEQYFYNEKTENQ